MKKLTSILILSLSLIFFGCKKTIITFDSDPVVEFKPISVTIPRGTVSSQTSGSATILVQLVGPHQATPISVPYSIDAANTTAIAGTNYTTSTNGTVTIPANSSSAQIIITGSYLNNTVSKKLVLVLGDGAVPVSPNYRTCTVTFSTTVAP